MMRRRDEVFKRVGGALLLIEYYYGYVRDRRYRQSVRARFRRAPRILAAAAVVPASAYGHSFRPV